MIIASVVRYLRIVEIKNNWAKQDLILSLIWSFKDNTMSIFAQIFLAHCEGRMMELPTVTVHSETFYIIRYCKSTNFSVLLSLLISSSKVAFIC